LGHLLAVDISLQVASLVEESFGPELASTIAFYLEKELGLLSVATSEEDLAT